MLEEEKITQLFWDINFFSSNVLNNVFLSYNLIIEKKKRRKRWRRRKIFWKRRKRFKFKKFRSKKFFFLFNLNKLVRKRSEFKKLNLLNFSTLTSRGINSLYQKLFYKSNKNFYKLGYKSKIIKRSVGLKKNYFLDNFFDFKENKKFKILLRNYDKKPYWKLRTSRILHWGFFFNKTLRKKRYKKFIFNFLRNKEKNYILSTIISTFCRVRIPFIKFLEISDIIINGLCVNNGTIYLLPRIFKCIFLNYSNRKFWKKAKRWSFLQFKKSQNHWLARKKNFPKYLKKSLIKNKIKNFDRFIYDSFSRSITTCYYYPNFYQFNFKVIGSRLFLLKLHMFRYKA